MARPCQCRFASVTQPAFPPVSHPRFSLSVLGAPLLEGPDGPLSGRATYRRRLALLAILAAARRPVGRERIVGLLWPEQTTESARRILSEALYVFRKELGEDVLVVTGDEVGLNPAVVRSDLGCFHAAVQAGELDRAVAAYGGPFLEGFVVSDAPEFERWAEEERERLARAYGGVLEALAEAATREGSVRRAVEWWERLAAHDRFSARAVLGLARALDAAGEPAAALRALEAHASLVRVELDAEPAAEVRALSEHLRRRSVPVPTAPIAAPVGATVRGKEPAAPHPPGGDDGRGAVEEDGVAAGAGVDPASPSAWDGDTDPGSARTMHRPRARWITGPLAGVAVVVLVLLSLLAARRSGESSAPVVERYDPRRVAVLYFDDHTPGGDLGYLASGLTEELIHQLSHVDALELISRNGVKPYRDGKLPLDSVVAALRVGTLVGGSVQRAGGRVRVTVQLVDAATLQPLDSETVERPIDDLFALQDALARQVGVFLRRRLGREVRLREQAAETRSVRAREQVLRAEAVLEEARRMGAPRDSLDRDGVLQRLARADSLLVLAERADPQWVRPPVLRGWTAFSRASLPAVRREAELEAALHHAERALRRAPGSPLALELRGSALFQIASSAVDSTGQTGRMNRAEDDLRAAVAGLPTLASAWSRLSQLQRYRGRFAESDLSARRALAEDAYLEEAPAILHRLYFGALMLGDYREAATACGEGEARFPADWRFVECRLTLVREDPSAAPDARGAWALVERLERMDPPGRARAEGRAYSPVYRRMVAASVSARAGDRTRARAEAVRAREAVKGDRELELSLDYDEAYLRLVLGEVAAARRLLDRLAVARPSLRPFLARDPLFRELFTEQAPGTAPGTLPGEAPSPPSRRGG